MVSAKPDCPTNEPYPQHAAARQQCRDQRADPAALVGGDELLHQREVDREDAGIADSDKDPEEHQEQPTRDHGTRSRREDHDAGGQRYRDRRQHEHRTTADPIAEPTPNEGTRDRAKTGSQQYRATLPVGQRPFLGQRRGDVADQKEIEEIEQVSNVSGTNQLPLICCQLLLLLQKFYHYILRSHRAMEAEPITPRRHSRGSCWKSTCNDRWWQRAERLNLGSAYYTCLEGKRRTRPE